MSEPCSLCVCGLWTGRRLVPGLLVGGGEDVVRGAINNGQVCVELNGNKWNCYRCTLKICNSPIT
jgi:hypothetical protein